jgi:cytochrome c-type biogenesis protein CcmF
MATLGRGALILALAIGIYACVAAVLGARSRDRRLILSARRAVYAMLGAVLVADAVFMAAILGHDFSFVTVAETSSRKLPAGYLVTSFWASQPGSLLLWLTVLVGFTATVLVTNRRSNPELMPWVNAILAGTTAFFASMLVFAASPFETQIAPADGHGLNPSLQNPYMVAHPPSLYLGYVGLAVPFAFCMAALLARQRDARWIVATRRWTLASWTFLGIGMLLGAHWAYVEVGWGGFWAWDPVENAALMPWLTATAFLHSVMVQEKKGMLKAWNVALVTATFALSIFGTFLTRSGIVSSIHAFVASNVGYWFVGYIAVILLGSTALMLARMELLRSDHRMESLVSREATFLFNNLLFVGLAFAVLWGVTFPLISEAVTGGKITVNAPFFDFFAVVFGLPLILLMGVGPVIAWRRASMRSLKASFGVPFTAGLVAGALLVLLGYGDHPAGLAAFSLCIFVAVAIFIEFARGTVARRALAGGSWPGAFVSLIGRNRRRYGGYIAHFAVVLFIIGATGATAYATADEAVLAPGQTMKVRNYTLAFQGVTRSTGPNYEARAAVMQVSRDGSALGTLEPGQRAYPAEGQTSNEVAIRTDWRTGEDLFLILDAARPDGSVRIKALINPLVNLIWIAALVFVLGAAIAAWPDRREARRLARRYAEAPPAQPVATPAVSAASPVASER